MAEFITRPQIPFNLMERLVQIKLAQTDPLTTGITAGFDAINKIAQGYNVSKEKEREQERVQQGQVSHDFRSILADVISKGGEFIPSGTGEDTQGAAIPGGISVDAIWKAMGGNGSAPFSGMVRHKTETPEEKALKARELKVKGLELGVKEQEAALESDRLKTGVPKGSVRAEEVNKLFGSEMYPAGTWVTPDQLNLAKSALAAGQKPMSGESAKVENMAEAGVRAVAEIRRIVSDPAEKKKLVSAKNLVGGFGGDTLGLVFGGTTAQILSDNIQEAGDAIARLRTGAAITATEESRYGGLLKGRFKTMDAYLNSLDIVNKFLEGVQQDMATGKRKFNGQAVPLPGAKPAEAKSTLTLSDAAKNTAQALAKELLKPKGK